MEIKVNNIKVAFNKFMVYASIMVTIMIEAIMSFVIVLGADALCYEYVDSYYGIEENVGLILVLTLLAFRIVKRIPRWNEKLQK